MCIRDRLYVFFHAYNFMISDIIGLKCGRICLQLGILRFDCLLYTSVSGTLETGSDETTSASSENLASQDSSISQNSEISLPEVSVGSEVAGIISKGDVYKRQQ